MSRIISYLSLVLCDNFQRLPQLTKASVRDSYTASSSMLFLHLSMYIAQTSNWPAGFYMKSAIFTPKTFPL